MRVRGYGAGTDLAQEETWQAGSRQGEAGTGGASLQPGPLDSCLGPFFRNGGLSPLDLSLSFPELCPRGQKLPAKVGARLPARSFSSGCWREGGTGMAGAT